MKKNGIHQFYLLALAGMCLAACQTYNPEPLNLREYAVSWELRTLEVTPAAQWVAELTDAPHPEAEPPGQPAMLHLEQARELLTRFNPALRVARAEAGITESRLEHAGLWDDPVLELLWGRKSPDEGSGELVLGAGMALTVPLSGRPKVARELSAAELAVAQAEIAALEWRVLQELEAAWTEWSLLSHKNKTLQSHLETLEHLHGRISHLVKAGEITLVQSRVLELDLRKTETALRSIGFEKQRKHNQVMGLLGLPKGGVHLVPELPKLVETLPSGENGKFAERIRQHPNVIAAQAAHDAAEARLKLEIRKQYPDLRLSPGVLDEGDETALTLGLGIPTAVWNRNRAGIAEALAARNAAARRAESAYEAAYFEFQDAALSWESAHGNRQIMEQEIAPLVDAQLRDLQVLLGLGEIDILLLHQGLADALSVKLELLEALREEALASIRLCPLLALNALEREEESEEIGDE